MAADFSWNCERGAGVLLHVSALPSEFGIGNLVGAAKPFIEFLSECGFSYWQICPLNPTGFGDSPYQTFSLFAGNPYFIDPAQLRDLSLLDDADLNPLRALPRDRCDFGAIYNTLPKILQKAFANAKELGLKNLAKQANWTDFEKFASSNSEWLEPYSLYTVLKTRMRGLPWYEWEKNLKNYSSAKKLKLDEDGVRDVECVKFVQWVFFSQYETFKKFAKDASIEIFGDVPIFPAADCADVWANPELFDLNPDGKPRICAGVGPDYFSPQGQMWGNPLYNWKKNKKKIYKFWERRLRSAFALSDLVRLDHFRGFADYWAIPAKAESAVEGKMLKGPGVDFFNYIRKKFPTQKFVAEDLGLLSKLATDLRDEIKIPAMAVLQFAFGDSPKNPYLPHNTKRDSVYYTGTHDNDTARGWYLSASEKAKDEFRRYFRVSGDSANWDMICGVLTNHAKLAIFPAQDILGLDSSARFNTPGEGVGNWSWRMTDQDFATLRTHTSYLNSMLKLTDRFAEKTAGKKSAKK